jgi:UDP-glucose 4-epimerase
MLDGEQPTIFGSGDKTRDYIHVSDVVRANLLAVERGYNEIYNISTGMATSDGKLFREVAKLLGYTKEPIYMPVRPGEVSHICLEAAKAERELGWQPRIPLTEGLLRTVGYYQKLP